MTAAMVHHSRSSTAPVGPSVLVCGIPIHPRVVATCARRGIDLADVVRTLRHPEARWPALHGGEVYLREALAIITADTGEVVATTGRQRALAQRQQPRAGAVRRSSGGTGGQAPTSIPALLDLLGAAGCDILTDRRHFVARHPERPGAQVVIPKTPSDHRSMPNAVAQIRRVLGIDLRS